MVETKHWYFQFEDSSEGMYVSTNQLYMHLFVIFYCMPIEESSGEESDSFKGTYIMLCCS